MKQYNLFKKIIFMGLYTASISGCGYKPKPIPMIRAEQCSKRISEESYRIGVELFDSPEENFISFNSKVNKGGFLPIYVVAENNGIRSIVLYGTGNIQFIDGKGNEWKEVGAVKMSSSTDRNPTLESILAVNKILGVLISSNASRYNSDMMRDFTAKILSAQNVVPPNQNKRGFVIFGIPEKVDKDEFPERLKSSIVRLKVYESGRGVNRYEFLFD